MRAIQWMLGGLLACMLLGACQPVRQPPALAVTLAKSEDQAQLRWEGDTAAIDLYSASGIGAATITWPGEPPAAPLLLRLHLRGLEGLQVAAGAQQAALSVDNAPPYTVRVEGGSAEPATVDLDVERANGVFSVWLGQSWLQNGGLNVQWVDFYR